METIKKPDLTEEEKRELLWYLMGVCVGGESTKFTKRINKGMLVVSNKEASEDASNA